MRRPILASICTLGVLICLSGWLAESSSATTLLPGDVQFRPGSGSPTYTVGGVPGGYGYVGGSAWESAIVGGFTGKVVSKLYQNGVGQYAFSYQLFNTSTSGSDMTSATIGDETEPWKGLTISETGADQSGLSVGDWTDGSPLAISRDTTSSGEGLRISFYNIFSGDGVTLDGTDGKSAVVWVVTGATSYTTTNVSILDSGYGGEAHAYAPIPEPAMLTLLGVGGLSLLVWGWRKRARRQ